MGLMRRSRAFRCLASAAEASRSPDPAVFEPASRKSRLDGGFSLVELVVVITILSVLTATVGLSFGAADRGRRSDADMLRLLDAQLRDGALFGGQVVGVRMTSSGAEPLRAGDDGWITDGTAVEWRSSAEWVTKPGPDRSETIIAYLPDGRNTAFSVTFNTNRGRVICSSDGWYPVTCEDV